MLLSSHDHINLHFMPIDNHCFACQHPSISVLASDIEALEDSGVPIVLPRGLKALPQAMLHASQLEDPLNGRIPALWEDMLFYLTPSMAGLTSDGNIDDYVVVLEALPDAPLLSSDTGYRLFTPSGRPTALLRRIVRRLQQQARLTQLTQEMIDLLRANGALIPAIIDFPDETLMVYRIEMNQLVEKLQATGSHRQLSTYCFAQLIVQSQKLLPPFRDIAPDEMVLH